MVARIVDLNGTFVLVSLPVADAGGSQLTDAERAVAELAARGLSNAAIAARRGCAQRTVANQLAAVFKKLGVTSRRELGVRLFRQGTAP